MQATPNSRALLKHPEERDRRPLLGGSWGQGGWGGVVVAAGGGDKGGRGGGRCRRRMTGRMLGGRGVVVLGRTTALVLPSRLIGIPMYTPVRDDF